jgi:predicted ATPase/transcriptional regulator with XRE-family HTH domain
MAEQVDSTKAILSFGKWVKNQRKALGLTQADLAQRVACSKSMINKIESDTRIPSKPIIELLALHLKIPPADYANFIHLARPDLLIKEDAYSSERETNTDPILLQPGNVLPLSVSSLIGREHDVAQVSSYLLRTRIRLLTLTGPGGIGKTHLALQVAAELKDKFADGVYFISLAPVRDPSLVLSTIVQALGLKSKENQRDAEVLVTYLREKSTLLILDNFEQALPATKAIAELLRFTAYLKVLVTSRTVLRLSFEQEYVVPALSVPEIPLTLDLTRLADSPAVKLYVQRAQAVRPDFVLTDENARSVAEICVRLGGVPLAITLAASRCKVLSSQAILARLSDDMGGALGLLSGGSHDLPARHQTIRQTIDWSYNLLDEREQTLFRRLSVFVGGCTLAAIEDVYNEIYTESQKRFRSAPSISALDLTISLIDKSLLRRGKGPDGEPRFYMLEILREYAFECLIANDELEIMRQQHAVYFLSLLDSLAPRLHGEDQELCLKHVDADYENIRAALTWSSSADIEMALCFSNVLWEYWLTRGYLSEGRAWLATILERSAPIAALTKHIRAQSLNGIGLLTSIQGDQETASSYLQEGLDLFLEVGDQKGEAWVLNHIGMTLNYSGQQEQAVPVFEQSLKLFRSLNAKWHSAWVLINLGEVYLQKEETENALPFLLEAREIFNELKYKRGNAAAIDRLARLALLRGDSKQAKALFSESLQLFDKIGDREGTGWTLHHLGRMASEDGENQQAIRCLIESLKLFNKLGDRWGFAWSLLRLAIVIREMYQPEQAAILFGAADAKMIDFSDRMVSGERDFIVEMLAEARSQADSGVWMRGQSLSNEKVMAWIQERPFIAS